MPPPPPRQAASLNWGKGRHLLVEAAQELFAERGYSAVSTRELASRAGVTEPMVFRHFGSKAGLFEVAVLGPFVQHLADYIADWESRAHHVEDPLVEARDFYRGVYRMFSANKHLVRALAEADSGQAGGSIADAFAEAVAPVLNRFAEILEAEQKARGFREFNPAIQARLMLGLAVSQAVFGPWTYAGSGHAPPSEEEAVEEMSLFTLYGAWAPPAGDRG